MFSPHLPSCRSFVFFLAASLLSQFAVPPAYAHDEEKESSKKNPREIGKALVLPAIDGPKPWSSKPVLQDPDRFSIAIMTDRTGGHRPGIWMKAVERVNWLRPDFVVSVGDLIEGYTENESEIDRQWKEFLGFIDQLEMKFFFVAGNHDVTNPTLHRIWREKFGKEWYSFNYKDVHFVCLLSEDPSARLGEEQLVWLENDLKEHQDSRWTLVFLHKPIWTYAERSIAAGNEDKTNWKRAEALLADRPHTIFAGHVHHYVQYQRNGQQYYSLATTGGGSRLRGVSYGEFDHITWLTMEKDGPRVVNLLLDGIQPANVVTEESIAGFRQFLAQVRIAVEPIFISGDALSQSEIRITVTNDYKTPISIDAIINGLPLVGLDMESQTIKADVGSGKTLTKVIPFSMKEPVELSRFRLTSLEAKVKSVEDNPLRAEWAVPAIIDREYQIASAVADVDGELREWTNATWWGTDEAPTLAGKVQNWNGPEDGSFKVAASFDDKNLFFAATVTDERIVDGDQLTITVDPRPLLSRLERNRLDRDSISFTIRAPKSKELQVCEVAGTSRAATDIVAYGRRSPSGYELEFSAPINGLVDAQGSEWSNFQLGARLTDVDSSEEDPCEILWRASKNRSENREFAHVIRK